jgi:hypothetical protein
MVKSRVWVSQRVRPIRIFMMASVRQSEKRQDWAIMFRTRKIRKDAEKS